MMILSTRITTANTFNGNYGWLPYAMYKYKCIYTQCHIHHLLLFIQSLSFNVHKSNVYTYKWLYALYYYLALPAVIKQPLNIKRIQNGNFVVEMRVLAPKRRDITEVLV